MRNNNKATIVIGLLLAGSISPSIAIADVRLLTESDSEGWIKPNQPIRISVDPQPKELAVFIGSTDVSSFLADKQMVHIFMMQQHWRCLLEPMN